MRQRHIATLFVIIALLAGNVVHAQDGAKILSEELIYDFGTIAEADGPASHIFKIKNPGTSPLVITRITASCGCTQPEWSKEPIAPGKTGDVKVTYNPKGRPGPFYKTISIFSNGKAGSYAVGIKGTVTPKPLKPIFIYPYSIGNLKLETKKVLFSSIRLKEIQGEKINVINEGNTSISIHIGKVPGWLNVTVNPEKIAPQETAEISILMNAGDVKKKGRITTSVPISIETIGEKKIKEDYIRVTANIIDDFSKLSASDKDKAPVAQLSGTLLDFGKLPSKSSFIPLIGGKVSGSIEITNTGKSPLIIYSATCDDDELVDISGGKKELKPGAKTEFKISLHPKEIKTKLETLVVFVCNDPTGPVRLVKVTAEK